MNIYSRKKMVIVGAGNVGGHVAFTAALRELCDVVLLEKTSNLGMAKGKALDVQQACSLFNADVALIATDDYADARGADVVIVTAGVARKPGMSRNELYDVNLGVVRGVSEKIGQVAPDALVVIVTNPLDSMAYACMKIGGFTSTKVVGMAGILDGARMQYALSKAIGCSIKDVKTLVLGGHGDEMVPLISHSSVNGIPVRELLSRKEIDAVVDKTRNGGGELVTLMGTSAYFAAATAVVEMAESFLKDQKRILPCSAYLSGEYGVEKVFMGVPVTLGSGGVEKIIELKLSDEETVQFKANAHKIRELTKDQ